MSVLRKGWTPLEAGTLADLNGIPTNKLLSVMQSMVLLYQLGCPEQGKE